MHGQLIVLEADESLLEKYIQDFKEALARFGEVKVFDLRQHDQALERLVDTDYVLLKGSPLRNSLSSSREYTISELLGDWFLIYSSAKEIDLEVKNLDPRFILIKDKHHLSNLRKVVSKISKKIVND